MKAYYSSTLFFSSVLSTSWHESMPKTMLTKRLVTRCKRAPEGVSLGRVGADFATKNVLKKIPHLNATTREILRQNASFKYNFIENHINK